MNKRGYLIDTIKAVSQIESEYHDKEVELAYHCSQPYEYARWDVESVKLYVEEREEVNVLIMRRGFTYDQVYGDQEYTGEMDEWV